MRVITGSAGGRRLRELAGTETRPTAARVKEGVFNALQFEIAGRRVLDLFAGTGQLGIECLSRGAASAVFVEQRAAAAAVIRENLRLTRLADRATVLSTDAMLYLERLRERFDLIFLDPPYQTKLLERSIACVAAFDILTPYGIMAAEHPAGKQLPALPLPYHICRAYRYGKIAVTLCRRDGADAKKNEDETI